MKVLSHPGHVEVELVELGQMNFRKGEVFETRTSTTCASRKRCTPTTQTCYRQKAGYNDHGIPEAFVWFTTHVYLN